MNIESTTRRKLSLGVSAFNDGEPLQVNQDRYQIDHSRRYYIFDIIPMGAVRMNHSDKWKVVGHPDPKKCMRPEVERYLRWKDRLRDIAAELNFSLPDQFEAVYFSPMPVSWSHKKKQQMLGLPCQTKPDSDNITKAIKDTLLPEDDSRVWMENAQKRWAYYGSIMIFT